MTYHPKHTITYYFKHIKFKRHIILAIGFLIADPLIINLLCHAIDAAIPSELDYLATSNVASSLFKVMIPIGLLAIWCFIAITDVKKQFYQIETGRNLSHDFKNYKRSFTELLDFFSSADPSKLDIAALPSLNWKDADGLIFGKVDDKLIHYTPYKNGIVAMAWGAPGDGKTTSIVIPSCRQFGMQLDDNGNRIQKGTVMTTDLKGDIYAANKDFRHIKRFSTIHWQDSAHFDPLISARSMDIGARKIFLENLAITLISNDGGSESKYFTDGARDFFTGISLYLLNKDNIISFPEIIQQIVIGTFSKWVIEIKDSDDEAAKAYTNHFYGENEKNVAGTYSKLVSATRLFSSPIMHTLLSNEGTQISPADLENCTDIYIQVDPNQMELMTPVIAMIYQTFMSAMLYRHEGQNPPIAFILDEFGQLPEMPVISQSAALLRAYNCSLLLSCQSLAMIEKHYGIAGRKLLMDCTKVHCFLSIMDPDTRDWASRLFGTRKVLKLSTSEQISDHSSSGRSVAEAIEPIFAPDDFGNLPNKKTVAIYYRGKYIEAQKTSFFDD